MIANATASNSIRFPQRQNTEKPDHKSRVFLYLSGSRESNPDHTFLRKPQQSPRLLVHFGVFVLAWVGEPGIEPGPHGPKPRTLPLCYTPTQTGTKSRTKTPK
jgi:hypothetical protein